MEPDTEHSGTRLADTHVDDSISRAARLAHELTGIIESVASAMPVRARSDARIIEALARTLADHLEGLRGLRAA